MCIVQYNTGSQTSFVTSAFFKSLGLAKFGEPCQKLIRCGLTGQTLTALKVHQLHFKVGMRAASTKVFEVDHIGVLGSPPSLEILEEMLSHRTGGCWSGEWACGQGEVDVLLAVDSLHLFSRSETRKGGMDFQLSVISGNYLIMGQIIPPPPKTASDSERIQAIVARHSQS